MKHKLHIIASTILFCLLVLLSSCEKDLYENTTNANSEKAAFDTKIISLKDVPEIESFVNNKIRDVVRKSKTGKLTDNPSNITFDIEKIVEVTDTVKNKNYSIRFVFEDTPENIFYNLIINVLPTGEKQSFVEKYTCDMDYFSAYKNSMYDFNNFKGTVDLYNANAFFSKPAILSKTTAVPCTPKFYPNGDPIPTISSFISAGGSTTGSGGASTSGGGLPTGGGTSLNVVIPGSSPTGSAGGTGCCSCGNCGTHYYPPTQKKDHQTQKTSVDPCPNIVPIGYIGVSAEPEKLQILRATLQISLQQWQWLHGKDDVIDFMQKYINSSPEKIIKSKEIALLAIDFMIDNPKKSVIPFIIEEQIDDSQLDPCSKNVLTKLKISTQSDIATMINRFCPSGSIFNIKMSTGQVIDPNNFAETTKTNGSSTDVNMVFNEDYIKGTNNINPPTDLSVATTMAHEVIHAYLISLLEENKNCGASGICDFPTIYDAYVQKIITKDPNTLPDAHHELIAGKYITSIAETIQEFHTGQSVGSGFPYQVYLDMAWGGLQDTYIFNKNYPNDPNHKNYKDRERILDRINAEKKGSQYYSATPIGTPCKK